MGVLCGVRYLAGVSRRAMCGTDLVYHVPDCDGAVGCSSEGLSDLAYSASGALCAARNRARAGSYGCAMRCAEAMRCAVLSSRITCRVTWQIVMVQSANLQELHQQTLPSVLLFTEKRQVAFTESRTCHVPF
eukprot:2879581-Rhodomonas_salina.1